MRIDCFDENSVCVIRVSGRIDAKSSIELETGIKEIINNGKTNLLINMDGVDYISSSGLRVLLSTLKKLKVSKGGLKIACLKPFVMDVFRISGFDDIFEIYDDEKKAVESFSG
ncbi:STAS domain-containing protein [Methanoplanus sp. FWC-SCC4]|uniref:STAS domain-containing protein n=1 Tax=Methanochimaera problematica TaxID=2609417 RepID=A0AA97FD72_9EURY|nr:STAS domain-containing protein [Methanoplanus sp. FWC-SCC4]WOF16382.1 STAS domain-containing protein [Methanoplanus sp. FWC-SCC4]